MKDFLPMPMRITGNIKAEKNTIDPVKGCAGNCTYCYMKQRLKVYGWAVDKPIARTLIPEVLSNDIDNCDMPWLRFGVMGDPSFNWPGTIQAVCLVGDRKKSVIMTKLWQLLADHQMSVLIAHDAQIQFGLDGLMTWKKIKETMSQLRKYQSMGGDAVLRIMTAHYLEGSFAQKKQNWLINQNNVRKLETPIRIFPSNEVYKKHFDHSKYERWTSYTTGKLTNYYYPTSYLTEFSKCATTCADCSHQCLTQE
jgi:hypothetical protein